MNKRILSLTTILVFIINTIPVYAVDIITPPIYTRPITIFNQKQSIQKQQSEVDHLITESKGLIDEIVAQKKNLPENKVFQDTESYNTLRDTLSIYQSQINVRDRMIENQRQQIDALKNRLGISGNILDEVVDASHDVGVNGLKAKALYQARQEKQTILNNQMDMLVKKDQQLADLKTNLVEVKEQLMQVSQKYSELSRQYQQGATNVKSNDESAAVITQLREQIKNLESQNLNLGSHNNQIKSITSSLNTKDDRLSAMEKSLIAKDEQIASLKSQLASAKDEIYQLKQQVQEGDQTLQDIHDKSVKFKEKYDVLAQDILAKDKQIAELKGRIEATPRVAQVVSQPSTAKSEDSSDVQELQAKLKQAVSDADALRADLARDDAAFKEIRIKGQALRDQISALQNQIQEKDDLLKQANLANQSKPVPVDDSGKAAMQERMKLQEELAAKYQKHIDMIDEKNRVLMAKTKMSEDEINGNKEKYEQVSSTLTADRNAYELKVSELQKQMDRMKGDMDGLNKTIALKNKEKEDLYTMMDQFKSRLKETSDINNDQQEKLDAYRNQIENMHQDVLKSKDQVQNNAMQVAALAQEKEKAVAQLDKTSQDASAKDLSLSMVQKSLDEQTKMHDAKVSSLKEQIRNSDQKIVDLQERLTVAEAKLKQPEKINDLSRLEDMLKASRVEVMQLTQAMKKKEEQIAALHKELESNAKEFESQNKAIESLQKDLVKQNARIKELNDEVFWRNREIERYKQQIKMQKLDLLKSSTPTSLEDQIHYAGSTQTKIMETQDDLMAATKSKDPNRLKEALKDAREQIYTLKSKLNQRMDKAVKNDPEYTRMVKQLQSLKEDLMKVIADYADSKEQNEQLRKELEEMKKSVEDCQARLGSFADPATKSTF